MLTELTARSTGSGDLILVVGNDVPTRRTIRLALENEGLAVEAVAGGWQALMFALVRRPSLMILDLDVSGLDGGDVVAGLQVAYGVDIPIVVVSDRRRRGPGARPSGAFAALARPFSPEDLLDAVYRGLAAARGPASGGGVPSGRLGGMRGAAGPTPGP